MEHEFTLVMRGVPKRFMEEVYIDHEKDGYITGISSTGDPIVECFVEADSINEALLVAVEYVLPRCCRLGVSYPIVGIELPRRPPAGPSG